MISVLERVNCNKVEIVVDDILLGCVRNDGQLGRVFEGTQPVSVETIVFAANMLNEFYNLEPGP